MKLGFKAYSGYIISLLLVIVSLFSYLVFVPKVVFVMNSAEKVLKLYKYTQFSPSIIIEETDLAKAEKIATHLSNTKLLLSPSVAKEATTSSVITAAFDYTPKDVEVFYQLSLDNLYQAVSNNSSNKTIFLVNKKDSAIYETLKEVKTYESSISKYEAEEYKRDFANDKIDQVICLTPNDILPLLELSNITFYFPKGFEVLYPKENVHSFAPSLDEIIAALVSFKKGETPISKAITYKIYSGLIQ